MDLISIALVLLSAPLYRIPRGGPDPVVWLRWTDGIYNGSLALGAGLQSIHRNKGAHGDDATVGDDPAAARRWLRERG
jgi:hypothetical protein